MQDLRYALRALRNSPGFTLTAALLVAAGIGANTVVFTALDAVLLRPLPVRQPGALVRMVQNVPPLGIRSYFAYPFYEGLRDQARSFAAVFAETALETGLNQPSPPEPVRVHLVSPEYFDALGVPALHGRTLSAVGAGETAVLSYHFWLRRFGGDPSVVGRSVVLHGHKFSIVGVMPREFNGTAIDTAPDLRVPIRAFPLLHPEGPKATMQYMGFELAGRLKPGVARERARAECHSIWRRVMEPYLRSLPDLSPNYAEVELSRGVDLEPLARGVSVVRDRFGGALRLLAASAAVLWLLVCANLAGLLLARGAARRQEIAVRLALGATRGRLLRQVLTECSLLTAAGALGGWLLASALTPLLVRALPPMRDWATSRLTLALDLSPDWRVLLFSIGISVGTVLLFGVAPALGAARESVESVLRSARSTGGAGRGRRALVTLQIALCTLLLAGAGLLVRTFQRLQSADTGFDAARIATFSADPSQAAYNADQAQALRLALAARVREIPGVVSVATASRPLLRGSGIKSTIAPAGQRASHADFLNSSINNVSPEFFDTLGIRLVAGRALRSADAGAKPARVVVNQAFARRFFPDGNAVGKRFGYALDSVAEAKFEIVGVVSNAKYRSLREPMTPTYYGLLAESGPFTLLVRTRGRPGQVIEPVRKTLAALDPALPFTEVHTLEQEVETSASGERLTAALASLFGALAAVLAAVGIYGLLAYVVAQRRREIGIRMALGARPADVAALIGRQSLGMLAAGVALGLTAALVLAPAMRSLLYGVPPADPVSLGGAAGFVSLVAALASAIPAARAIRVEPAAVLRDEA